MTDYMKLGAPQFETGDDPFVYLERVKAITDEIGADDSRAIQMAGFTLKCKKAREWFKNYVNPRVDSMTWEEFANEFAGWDRTFRHAFHGKKRDWMRIGHRPESRLF